MTIAMFVLFSLLFFVAFRSWEQDCARFRAENAPRIPTIDFRSVVEKETGIAWADVPKVTEAECCPTAHMARHLSHGILFYTGPFATDEEGYDYIPEEFRGDDRCWEFMMYSHYPEWAFAHEVINASLEELAAQVKFKVREHHMGETLIDFGDGQYAIQRY